MAWALVPTSGIQISEAEISILFIGNSLTTSNDMTGMVVALLDSIGAGPTYVWQQTANGTGLEDHGTSGDWKRSAPANGTSWCSSRGLQPRKVGPRYGSSPSGSL